MTDALTDSVGKGEWSAELATLLGCFTEDGIENPTIEDWLSRIRAMRSVAGSGEVRGISAAGLDGLEKAVTSGIVGLVGKRLPDLETPFHQLAVWAGAVERAMPVEIFTTNYDLLIEQAFEAHRTPFFDGFVGADRPFFDNASVGADQSLSLPPRFARLWKLHGSINWYLDADGRVMRTHAVGGERRLIHPSHLKYDESRQMPYLALLDRLRAFLGQRSARLVTCGYSFGDQHINSVMGDALQANPTASLVGLFYGAADNYPEALKMAKTRSNFAMFASDAAVIGTRKGAWAQKTDGEAERTDGEKPLSPMPLGDFVQFGTLLAGLLDRPVGES
jgi:hypothetical protein